MFRTFLKLFLVIFVLNIARTAYAQEDDECRREGELAAITKSMSQYMTREQAFAGQPSLEEIEASIANGEGQKADNQLLARYILEDVYSNPTVSQFSHLLYRSAVCLTRHAGVKPPITLKSVVNLIEACQRKHGTEYSKRSNKLVFCIAKVVGVPGAARAYP